MQRVYNSTTVEDGSQRGPTCCCCIPNGLGVWILTISDVIGSFVAVICTTIAYMEMVLPFPTVIVSMVFLQLPISALLVMGMRRRKPWYLWTWAIFTFLAVSLVLLALLCAIGVGLLSHNRTAVAQLYGILGIGISIVLWGCYKIWVFTRYANSMALENSNRGGLVEFTNAVVYQVFPSNVEHDTKDGFEAYVKL